MIVAVSFSCKKHDVEPQYNSTLVVKVDDSSLNDRTNHTCEVIIYYSLDDWKNNQHAISDQYTDTTGVVTFKNIKDAPIYIRASTVASTTVGYTSNAYVTEALKANQTTNVTVKLPY